MWVMGEVIESQLRAKQVALFPLGPLPTYSTINQRGRLPHPGKYLRLSPLQCNRCAKTKTYGQMKEQIKTLEKELGNKEIANLSEAQFETLVIRMLTEITEYRHIIEEELKAMQSEVKENIQGNNSEGKETRTQIKYLDQKEEINIQPKQIKK